MKLIRKGLVIAAGAVLLLPAATAQAATPQTLRVTSFSGPDSQGWLIDDNGQGGEAYPYQFVAGNNPPLGTGSLQFAANDPVIPAEKMFVKRAQVIPAAEFRTISFDYYFAAGSATTTPNMFYLNLYVDTAVIGTHWYDCKYDYLANRSANGVWATLTALRERAADVVTEKNSATCPKSISQLQPTDKIFLIALNAGDTSNTDAGIRGGFDKVVIETATSNITYDFEPTPACRQSGLPVITGTARSDLKNGTDAAEKIDLLAGNDSSEARGGADCVLGGDGNDRLLGGPGDDEIAGGAGSDLVDPGAGLDVVDTGAGNDSVNARDRSIDRIDCGPGNDVVQADPADILTNCEVQR